jgi:hypothetical protein
MAMSPRKARMNKWRHRRQANYKLDTSKSTAVGRKNRQEIARRFREKRAGKKLKSPVMMSVREARSRLCK